MVKLPTRTEKDNMGRTSEKLASIANVSEKTYRMGAKILNSDNEKLKQEVLSGEKSINAGYRELTGKRIRIYNRSQIWERYIMESTLSFPKKETLIYSQNEYLSISVNKIIIIGSSKEKIIIC